MNKHKLSKFFFWMTTVSILLAILFLVFSSKVSPYVSSYTSSGLSKVDNIISIPFNKTKSSIGKVQHLFSTYKDNRSLKLKLENESTNVEQLKSLKRKNASLRALLNLETNASFKKVSEILVRNPYSWSDSLIIKGGKQDGINTSMTVVNGKYLIGSISNISDDSSHVNLLTSGKNFNLPIKIVGKKETIFGNLKTYNKETKLMVASEFNSNVIISTGDKVYTSGLDGVTVPDISIGKVKNEIKANDKLDRRIYISLGANFKQIDYLYVLGRDN
ncbi:rod shape-determining protein MreC [Streptococcus parauberis]|uniref:rod shape-determining protein MreC n=1 Tax=Streptococcus parauberis TaxID=1348 RepID=UPI000CCE32B3|nr:rod shape-determining protein MreC [Streptococcus parauberis]PNY18289.1 Cell shape-determining protein MreC precursor [Streptococcus parauberis]